MVPFAGGLVKLTFSSSVPGRGLVVLLDPEKEGGSDLVGRAGVGLHGSRVSRVKQNGLARGCRNSYIAPTSAPASPRRGA